MISASSGLQSPRDRLHAMAFDLAQRYSPCMGLGLICRGMRGKKKKDFGPSGLNEASM